MLKKAAMLVCLWMPAAVSAASAEEPPVGPNDPFDERHVLLTATVEAKDLAIDAVQVRRGAAHAQLAEASALRVALLDRRGQAVREMGLPSPLEQRRYRLDPLPIFGGDVPVWLPERPHDMEVVDKEVVSIVLPLLPGLDAVSLGWRDGIVVQRDVVADIKRACARDLHRACRAWMEAHP